MSFRARCLCGAVALELDGPLDTMVHCHCSMCRKAHGAAFATGVGIAAKDVRWRGGTETVGSRESAPGCVRAFCARCGSVVPDPRAGERVFVPAGLLDDDPGIRPEAHIFVGSKAPWHEIADELPRFDAYPPGYPPVAFARPTDPVPDA